MQEHSSHRKLNVTLRIAMSHCQIAAYQGVSNVIQEQVSPAPFMNHLVVLYQEK